MCIYVTSVNLALERSFAVLSDSHLPEQEVLTPKSYLLWNCTKTRLKCLWGLKTNPTFLIVLFFPPKLFHKI